MENKESILRLLTEVGKTYAYQRVVLAQTKPNWPGATIMRALTTTAVTSSEVAIAVFQKEVSWVAAMLHSLNLEWEEDSKAEYQKLAHEAISMTDFSHVQKVEFPSLKKVKIWAGLVNNGIEPSLKTSGALHYYLGVTPRAVFPISQSQFRSIMLGFRKQLLDLDLSNRASITLMLYHIGMTDSYDISEMLRTHYTRGARN